MAGARRTAGVIGGLGPAATIDFMARVLARTEATRDQDHVRLLVDCNPAVPDRNAAVAGRGESPAPALAAMARGLERAGADFLVMPCNAAHAFADAIRGATALPFIDLIDLVVEWTVAHVPNVRRIAVLGSTGCLDARLYPRAFAPHDVSVVVPEGVARDRFMALLHRIKTGDLGVGLRGEMLALAMEVAEGCDALIAGCTEVPLVLGADDIAIPLINSTGILAERTVIEAGGRMKP
jgi:aspartate racemase